MPPAEQLSSATFGAFPEFAPVASCGGPDRRETIERTMSIGDYFGDTCSAWIELRFAFSCSRAAIASNQPHRVVLGT